MSPLSQQLSSYPETAFGHFCASLGCTSTCGCSRSPLWALGGPESHVRPSCTQTGTGQAPRHLTALLGTGNWEHAGQLLPRGLGRSSHNLSSTFQSSDVKRVLLVLLYSGIWPEGLASLSTSSSMPDSLGYILTLHLLSAQFSSPGSSKVSLSSCSCN